MTKGFKTFLVILTVFLVIFLVWQAVGFSRDLEVNSGEECPAGTVFKRKKDIGEPYMPSLGVPVVCQSYLKYILNEKLKIQEKFLILNWDV